MHKNITRGLAVAALTGGFTILGATAANAIDIGDGILGDEGGLLGTGLLAGDTSTPTGGLPVDVNLPVDVSGVDVSVLDGALDNTQLGGILGDDGNVLGNGVVVTVDEAVADAVATVGTGDNDVLHSIVGVPIDLSGSWGSVLGNPETGGANGVVVQPEVAAEPFAFTEGILDSFIHAPISISCVTVSVLSDFLGGDCEPNTPAPAPGEGNGAGGLLDLDDLLGGDVLGDDILGDGVLDLNDLLEIDGVLDGDILGDGVLDLDEVLELDGLLGGDLLDGDLGLGSDLIHTDLLDDGVLSDDIISLDDGLLVDPADTGSLTTVTVDAVDTIVGVPLDLSGTWASVLGENGGVVIVPDLSTAPTVLFGDELLAHLPISIDCASIVILSDYERDCAGSAVDPTDPTDPVDPTEPTVPSTPEEPTVSDEFHVADNGGTGDVGGESAAGAPCIPAADNTAAVDRGIDYGMLAAAALAGALAALAMVALTRRFSVAK